ncbi:40S ribosomal protein S8 [Ramicandelaber brevisporus]|nr:40S ribosomal protein S8 [Ramicandelaber brevisporus]
MALGRDSRHKRSHTGARRAFYRKKRKFEAARQPAMTKMGPKRIHTVRVRGGNVKFRAMRLDTGNFAWASESATKKARIVAVVYNASNNELVRTNTLVKGAIVQIDATPFRQYYENFYALPIGRKNKAAEAAQTAEGEAVVDPLTKPRSAHNKKVIEARQAKAKVEQAVADQFVAGRLYAIITSRPGQSGRADGYILEGKELEFYARKLKK